MFSLTCKQIAGQIFNNATPHIDLDVSVWTGFNWLRMGSSGGLL